MSPDTLLLCHAVLSGTAWSQTPLRVKMFPGAQALPVMAAMTQGMFERYGLKVEVLFTVNSQKQRDGLASGDFQIAQAAVDNAVDLIGPYQGSGTFVLRSWGTENAEILERYIAAFIEGNRWAVDPANKAAAVKILTEGVKITPEVATRTCEILSDPNSGLARDGRFDMQGFRNVLALRAELEGGWGGKPPQPERYVDLSFYENAFQRASTR